MVSVLRQITTFFAYKLFMNDAIGDKVLEVVGADVGNLAVLVMLLDRLMEMRLIIKVLRGLSLVLLVLKMRVLLLMLVGVMISIFSRDNKGAKGTLRNERPVDFSGYYKIVRLK